MIPAEVFTYEGTKRHPRGVGDPGIRQRGMNARQGTLAARGQRRISGVPDNAKVNHSPLKIGNKSPIFRKQKFKTVFAPFFAETETRPLQKAKERRTNGLSIKKPSRFFSHPTADFAKRGSGRNWLLSNFWCLKTEPHFLGEVFVNGDKQINRYLSSAIEETYLIHFCHDFALVGLTLMDFDRPGDDVVDKHVDIGPDGRNRIVEIDVLGDVVIA